MTITYTEITDSNLAGTIIRHNEDGTDTYIPMVAGNADYEFYLNPVEHLTEIPTKEAYDATLASELSNPSTPQAGE
jgi:hypothetical protein